MFFGKNKTSLRLSKPHPILVEGCEYHVVESVRNPTKVTVGVGITKLLLRDKDGQEFIVEGNAAKIKELLIPVYIFENVEGPTFKLKLPVGSLQRNEFLKETNSIHPDEKIYLGHGVSERYFIQRDTNKVIKFIGNPSQIKNILDEQVEKPKFIEKVIIKEVPKPQVTANSEQTVKIVVEDRFSNSPNRGPVTVEKGEKGDRGERGFEGPIGPRGERGPQGEQGPQGEKGEPGIKGEKGDVGPMGPIGVRGPIGPQGQPGPKGDVGPQGPVGPQGEMGEKGDKGDPGQIGPQGIQGPIGPRGPAGPQGIPGPQGDPGKSPVLEAQFPLILEDGVLSFNSAHVSAVLEQLKNQDIQKTINQIAMTTPAGGGAVDISLNGEKVIRSVNTVNFIGNGITVTRRRKNVDIDLSGLCGGGGGAGISGPYVRTLKSTDGTVTLSASVGDIDISILPAKSVAGTIQYRATTKAELAAQANFKLNTATQNLEVPNGLIIGITAGAGIQFADGTTQYTRSNIFTEGATAPLSISAKAGDRWFNTGDAKLYTAITDPGSTYPIWVEFGTSSGLGVSPSVPSGYTTFANLSSDKTCDVNATNTTELANILGTLIEDLKSRGIISS